MRKVILERLLSTLISLFVATLFVFFILQSAPTDPISLMLKTPGQIIVDKEIRDKKIDQLQTEYGIKDPPLAQYGRWIKKLLHFDLGKSLLTGETVMDGLKRTLPHSIKLGFLSTLIQMTVAVFLGALSAMNYGGFWDRLIRFFCILIKSIPFFAICIVVLTYFSTKLFWYEISTEATLKRMILPALVVGITLTPKLIRLVRVSILDELGKIYILDAVSKGYKKRKIILYALKNATLPIITMISISFAANLGGMTVTESIFSWPGVGRYALDAVLKQDYFVVQAYILVVVFIVLSVNFLTDILYSYLNPKIRHQGGRL